MENSELLAYSFACTGKDPMGSISVQHIEYRAEGENWKAVKDRLGAKLSLLLSGKGIQVTGIADAIEYYKEVLGLTTVVEKYLTQSDIDKLEHWYEDNSTSKQKLGFFPDEWHGPD